MKAKLKAIGRDWKNSSRNMLWLLFFGVVVACFTGGVIWFSGKADTEGTETLRSAIRRASVQCYAIEGRYPPSVQYLEDNYGIQIDKERYHVFYNGFASNIMPEITVVEAQQEE